MSPDKLRRALQRKAFMGDEESLLRLARHMNKTKIPRTPKEKVKEVAEKVDEVVERFRPPPRFRDLLRSISTGALVGSAATMATGLAINGLVRAVRNSPKNKKIRSDRAKKASETRKKNKVMRELYRKHQAGEL